MSNKIRKKELSCEVRERLYAYKTVNDAKKMCDNLEDLCLDKFYELKTVLMKKWNIKTSESDQKIIYQKQGTFTSVLMNPPEDVEFYEVYEMIDDNSDDIWKPLINHLLKIIEK